MDGYLGENRDELERRIHEMMAEQTLPPGVTGYHVQFGNYMDGGDPAVWINFHIPANLKLDDNGTRQLAMSLIDFRQRLVPLVPDYLALGSFRTPLPAHA